MMVAMSKPGLYQYHWFVSIPLFVKTHLNPFLMVSFEIALCVFTKLMRGWVCSRRVFVRLTYSCRRSTIQSLGSFKNAWKTRHGLTFADCGQQTLVLFPSNFQLERFLTKALYFFVSKESLEVLVVENRKWCWICTFDGETLLTDCRSLTQTSLAIFTGQVRWHAHHLMETSVRPGAHHPVPRSAALWKFFF